MAYNQKISVSTRLILLLFVLVYLASFVIGLAYAVFGSRSDVNQGEQLAALIYGIGMVASGAIGFMAASRVEAASNLKLPLGCVVAAVVSFLLAITFGP